MEPEDGRTAWFDPVRDRWREVSIAPRPTARFTPYVWTGTELVITEVASDGSSIGGLAYDPAEDRWRELAHMPFTPASRDYQLADAVWTGTHIIVVELGGLVAAYDVAADCWAELGDVPGGEGVAEQIYLDGTTLFIESRDFETGTSMQGFDLATGEWSEPAIAPFEVASPGTGGSWVGDQLVYLTWAETDEDGVSAAFDPATMTWAQFEHDCTTDRGWRTIEADGVLVSSDGRRALDPTTLSCTALPKPPRPLNGTESFVWTGEELIAWGGVRESLPPRRSGTVYRPAPTTGLNDP